MCHCWANSCCCVAAVSFAVILRTAVRLLCCFRPVQVRARPWKVEEQEVSFHRNGTVETSAGDAGTWWFDVGGLYWVSVVVSFGDLTFPSLYAYVPGIYTHTAVI